MYMSVIAKPPTRTQTHTQPPLSTFSTHFHSNLFPSILLQLCVSRSMQLILLANIRGVSHGSALYLPAPAVLLISRRA